MNLLCSSSCVAVVAVCIDYLYFSYSAMSTVKIWNNSWSLSVPEWCVFHKWLTRGKGFKDLEFEQHLKTFLCSPGATTLWTVSKLLKQTCESCALSPRLCPSTFVSEAQTQTSQTWLWISCVDPVVHFSATLVLVSSWSLGCKAVWLLQIQWDL